MVFTTFPAANQALLDVVRRSSQAPCTAVFPTGPRPSAKVRAFVDFLAEKLRKPA
jgi:hypothetical protein